jgi:hypothetical protein
LTRLSGGRPIRPECADFDKAIEIASKQDAAKLWTIEIGLVWLT